jgi:lipopolysaccharide transport system permease protein/teichoic acid transport system permease protein
VARDFKSRYLGSYLGLIWAFINPMVTILVFWFVFQVGFKSKPVGEYPFVLWLTTAFVPWFFFSDGMTSAGNSIVEYSYLVKKVSFRVSMLPIVKIISALLIHLFFIGILFLSFGLYGYPPDRYSLQILYYLTAMLVLLLGVGWLTSSLTVFLKDVSQINAVLLQLGFWMTPIFWDLNILPEKYHFFIKLNPVFYLTEGYRNTFIHKIWFWEHPLSMLYFWTFSLIVLIGGALLFRGLKPHFADVL